MLAKEISNGCISALPVPIVKGVLSEAQITPSMVWPAGNVPCILSAEQMKENNAAYLIIPSKIGTHKFTIHPLPSFLLYQLIWIELDTSRKHGIRENTLDDLESVAPIQRYRIFGLIIGDD